MRSLWARGLFFWKAVYLKKFGTMYSGWASISLAARAIAPALAGNPPSGNGIQIEDQGAALGS
jgi:hypothetical protein